MLGVAQTVSSTAVSAGVSNVSSGISWDFLFLFVD